MQKRTKVIIGVIVVIIIALVGYGSTKKKPVNYTSAKVEKGEVVQTVSATGEVEAASKVDLKFASSEQIKEIDVKVGDNIKQGAIIARLDTSKLDSQLLQAQAALAAATANYQSLVEGASAEDIKVAQTGVDNAETALASAKQSLADTTSSADREIASAQSSLDSSKVALDNANLNLSNVKVSNENSLNNSYEAAWDAVNSSLATCDDALNANDTVLSDEGAKNTLSVLNTKYLYNSNVSKAAADASRDSAKSYRDSVTSSHTPANVDTALSKAQKALEDTQKTLSDTYNVLQATVTSAGLTQAELDGLKSSISAQRTAVNTAISNLTSKKQAIQTQKVTNQNSLDGAQSSVNSANSSYVSSQNNLLAVKTSVSAKINSAQNNVTASAGGLKQAQEQLNQVKAKPSDSKLAASQAQVDQAQANVDLIQNQISEYTLLAPQDGLVTILNGEVGELASMSEAFASMIVPNGFQIKANIAEVDIAKLKANDGVKITFDALGSDKEFEGKVSEIDPAETVISGVVYYKVTTIFTDGDNIIKPGMTANMDIQTAKKTDILKVPFQAVKEKDGKKYVQIVSGKDQFSESDVLIGLKGDSDYEIKSGVQEGQEVVTFMGK